MSYSISVIDPREIESGDLKTLLAYWEQARGDKFAPAYGSDFRLDDIPHSIVPCCTVVDVVNGGEDYRYRFWGTENVTIKGFEMSGRLMSECEYPDFVEYGQAQFNEVMKRRAPTAFVYLKEYKNLQHRRFVAVRFPISKDGKTIDKVFSWQNLIKETDQWSAMLDNLNDPMNAHRRSVLPVT